MTQTRQKNPSLLLSIGMDKGDSDVVVFECMCEGFPCGMGGSPGTVDKWASVGSVSEQASPGSVSDHPQAVWLSDFLAAWVSDHPVAV